MGLRGPNAKPVKKTQISGVFHLPKTYSKDRIERNIQFIEALPVTSGILAGTKFKLRPFQREIIESIYKTNEDGLRLVREAVISMPRKNGKTGLTAVIALLHFCGPEAVQRGQVYSAATERKQAALLYDEMKAMIDLVPEIKDRVITRDFQKQFEDVETGTVFFALSADAESKHGYSASCWIYDELAQARDRKLYEVISSSTAAHAEPLGIVISTQSGDPNHVMSELVDYGKQIREGTFDDPAFYSYFTSAPENADPWSEKTWYDCNPALGDYRSLEELRSEARKAQRMPSREASFRLLYLNQRINSQSSLFSRTQWLACASKSEQVMPKEEIYLALDLASTNDLAALVACSANSGDRVKAWFWKPGDTIAEHSRRDRVPYDLWVKQGWIEAPKGKAIDYSYVAYQIGVLCQEYKVLALGYDRWHMAHLMREFEHIGLRTYKSDDVDTVKSGLQLVPFGQGFQDMTPAINAWEASVLRDTFKHDGNPVLAFCVANAIPKKDPAGNRKLDKSATRFRIDGAVAAAMAIGLKAKHAKKSPTYHMSFV